MRLTDEERADRAMTEKQLRGRILYRARKNGWKAMSIQRAVAGQWQTPASKGFPDLMLVKAGQPIIFAELKRELGRVTPEQTEWLELLSTTGAIAGVWRPSNLRSGFIGSILAMVY